jgi:hypothetical protein
VSRLPTAKIVKSLFSCTLAVLVDKLILNVAIFYLTAEGEAPRERPKLNLAPRSKPSEDSDQVRGEDEDRDRPAPSAPSGVSNASIFGGAKPVDTLARELEIEERNAKERAARYA